VEFSSKGQIEVGKKRSESSVQKADQQISRTAEQKQNKQRSFFHRQSVIRLLPFIIF
jgi:hypothetical protein